VFGARGDAHLDITLYGPSLGLHSGHYGNWAPNPAMMLAQLLAGMKDSSGNVLIPRFYDGITPLGAAINAPLAPARSSSRLPITTRISTRRTLCPLLSEKPAATFVFSTRDQLLSVGFCSQHASSEEQMSQLAVQPIGSLPADSFWANGEGKWQDDSAVVVNS
jgi:hypothetical protein